VAAGHRLKQPVETLVQQRRRLEHGEPVVICPSLDHLDVDDRCEVGLVQGEEANRRVREMLVDRLEPGIEGKGAATGVCRASVLNRS
jgi:hypothetical protein